MAIYGFVNVRVIYLMLPPIGMLMHFHTLFQGINDTHGAPPALEKTAPPPALPSQPSQPPLALVGPGDPGGRIPAEEPTLAASSGRKAGMGPAMLRVRSGSSFAPPASSVVMVAGAGPGARVGPRDPGPGRSGAQPDSPVSRERGAVAFNVPFSHDNDAAAIGRVAVDPAGVSGASAGSISLAQDPVHDSQDKLQDWDNAALGPGRGVLPMDQQQAGAAVPGSRLVM